MSPTRSLSSTIGNVVLWLLAAAGAICIILVVVGLWLNISIMMFRTGSMEPTIETGSVALVREIPAVEITEGDVVTVDRGEELLPVTHRVTEITDVNETTGEVTFVMRGDANDVDDPKPYTTDTVRRAFFSIPGIAPIIQWFQNPYVLGGLTLGATGLVIWAFWPRDDEEGPTKPQPKRGKHRAQTIAIPALLILTAPLLSVDQQTSTDHHGDYLRLRSTGDIEHMKNLAPGDSATWIVDVWADAPEPSPVELTLSAAGQLISDPDGLKVEVVICHPDPKNRTTCAVDTEPRVFNTGQLAHRGTSIDLTTMSSEETRRVLLTATLAENAPEKLQDTTAAFQITATGHHEELSVSPGLDPPNHIPVSDDHGTTNLALANTGFRVLLWIVLGSMVVLIGAVLVTRRHQRHHSTLR
ncbi:MAG TPA: signal peptidase I [Enteractinococcus helveticum]|uniref:Signal peptidase I n=1 Tax=Enteractinococcus helveticum TaxID=1837282 RepID=A0A921FKA2_9MICC|nr:signal peptidase I [Enteractinococcus helveticum]HJF13420.1 signal peptidase I [Enteractinococcus helveticum]